MAPARGFCLFHAEKRIQVMLKELTDEDVKFKEIKRYTDLKRRFNKRDINDWYEKTYRHPQSIGSVSNFFKQLNPKTLEEAYDGYILSGILDTDKKPEDRGRTTEELEALAMAWKKDCGVDLPLVDFYDALVLHAVIETCLGMIKEREAQSAYTSSNFTIKETDGYDDRTCGIDFIADDGKKKFLVQVKPDSFFRGKKKDLVQDRIMAWTKHELGKKKYPGASYTYMVYDRSGKWLKRNGRFNFRYWELMGKNGLPVVDIDGREFSHEDKLT